VQNWVSKVDNSFFIVWDTTLKEKKGKSWGKVDDFKHNL
jgi:hypothetical protein